MTLHPGNQHTALGRDRQGRLYAIVRDLAGRGEPLPGNMALREMLGIKSAGEGSFHRCVSALVSQGLIKFHYGASTQHRRAEVCETGAMTEWAVNLRPQKTERRKSPRMPKVAKEPKPLKVRAPKVDKPPAPKRPAIPGAYTFKRGLAGGYSDSFLYGHLAGAVRDCRRRGDVVYRDPLDSAVILINGRAGDVIARAGWHARVCATQIDSRGQLQEKSSRAVAI